MKFLFGFLMLLFTLASFVVGVVFLIARAFGQLVGNPESKAFKRMLDTLRSRVRMQSGNLIPWDGEMLSLLSLNRINEKKAGWFQQATSGQFTTIYQEPVVSYLVQSVGKTSVAIALTSNREYIFRLKGRETEIWLDGAPFAVLADGALLAAGRGSRLLARLEDRPGETQSPLLLGDVTAVTLNNPARATSPNPRALTLLRELNHLEEDVALAVALLKMVQFQAMDRR